MLDWLKTILGDAYTEEIDKRISAEIGKGFVARTDFNDLSAAGKNVEQKKKPPVRIELRSANWNLE